MAEIGLGTHYLDHNGIGTCKNIRLNASKLLSAAIDKHHKSDMGSIAKPKESLINLVQLVAKNESPDQILTHTWGIASEVIATHIHAAHLSEGSREEVYRQKEADLRTEYSNYLQPRIQHSAAY